MINYVEVKFSLDGNQWCALMGENLQEGTAGFGDTPIDAFEDLVQQLRVMPGGFSPCEF